MTTVDETVPCSTAIRRPNPDTLLSAFRAARLVGGDATRCLAPKARRAYCDVSNCPASAVHASPGPVCLRECFGYRLVDLTVFSLTREQDGSLSAYIETVFRNAGGKTVHLNEALVVQLSRTTSRITYAAPTT